MDIGPSQTLMRSEGHSFFSFFLESITVRLEVQNLM